MGIAVQTITCLDTLARAYYGLPLRPENQPRHEKKAYTISLRASARKGWITPEGSITEEGLRVFVDGLRYWRERHEQAN